MIAGGTGIAPMVQVIRACLRNPSDKTRITLIYANVNVDDILLKTDLEELQNKHGEDRFKIFYVLNNPPAGWTGGAGFVTKEHIKEHIPNPATTDGKLLICGKQFVATVYSLSLKYLFLGPPPMVNAMKSVAVISLPLSCRLYTLISQEKPRRAGIPCPEHNKQTPRQGNSHSYLLPRWSLILPFPSRSLSSKLIKYFQVSSISSGLLEDTYES